MFPLSLCVSGGRVEGRTAADRLGVGGPVGRVGRVGGWKAGRVVRRCGRLAGRTGWGSCVAVKPCQACHGDDANAQGEREREIERA